MLKSVNDYLPELIAQFPTVPPEDVKRAVEYGWRMLYYYNLRGCDTLISSTKYRYWFYCGQLTRDSIMSANANNGANAGFGYLNANNRSSNANANIGFRFYRGFNL